MATLGQPHLQRAADLAREVRYRWFDEPPLHRAREAAWAQARADVGALPSASPEAARAIQQRLIASPQPLNGLFIALASSAPAAVGPLLVSLCLQRYCRSRPLERVASFGAGTVACARAECSVDGARTVFLACFSSATEVDAAVGALARVAGDEPPEAGLALDFYLWEEGPRRSDDELAGVLRAALEAAGLGRARMRAAFVVTGPERGHGKAGQQHFTFHSGEGGLVEERSWRGIHPMLAERLHLGRLSKFELTRLPSTEDVYLFSARARSNPKDERLFAAAEVRDLTPERSPSGRVLRLPQLERVLHEALSGMRLFQARRAPGERLEWNRVVLSVRPPVLLSREEMHELVERISPGAEGAGLEMAILAGRMQHPDTGELRPAIVRIVSPDRHGVQVRFDEMPKRPLEPLGELQVKITSLRRRGLTHPYEIAHLLSPADGSVGDIPAGEFVEHDLDEQGALVPVQRPPGKNTAHLVAGTITNFPPRHPEGMKRVILLGDPGKEMGSVSEPECRRIIAAIDLAERLGVPLEWFTLSAGAKISMQSGTENMDWVSRALRRIVEFTQRGGEINVVVVGINVGAQPYWNAEATMLMHTRGILVMTPDSAMVLTGKQALEYSGGVAAEDNQGIGGYDRIMGPNGQAQYWAKDLAAACRLLLRHYEHCYVAPGERFPRRAVTVDPIDRDVCLSPHGGPFATVGDVFSARLNPERKKPFEIRRVMQAAIDKDHPPLERWRDLLGGETAVVWDAHLGGNPVCLIGIESRPVPRTSSPADGPELWTAGTLFPQSSKKIARAINAASGSRPVVVLANLSGFDGSPESMRRLQLEYGAEIARAVINFTGPIVFCVVSRYHGGAFVVFSKALREDMEIAALEGAYASVIGGAPAAAVVFAREVETRTRKDPRLEAAAGAGQAERERVAELVRSEKLGEVAAEYDRVHGIERALKVGSLDRILAPRELRPYLVDAVERGIAKSLRKP
jgi:acetyl-CoA carboxylase carboxyltransferase component